MIFRSTGMSFLHTPLVICKHISMLFVVAGGNEIYLNNSNFNVQRIGFKSLQANISIFKQ